MAGTIDMAQPNNYSTFNRNARNSFSRSYYINSYGDVPTTGCEQAPTTAPEDDITKKYTVSETDYYVPSAAITGLETTTYSYTGNDIIITPFVTYFGGTMTENTDYEIRCEKKNGANWESVTVIKYEGDYRFIISGKGNYSGSYTSPTIQVVEYKTWDAVKTILADASLGDRIITLSGDIYPDNPSGADVALVVNGNVVLNLAGHTIDRKLYTVSPVADPVVKGQVIRVSSGANLTINGGGSRNAIKGGYNYADGTDNDAGGIYNKGNLVLNNVNVVHNGCMKGNQSATNATARGGGVFSGSGSSLVINGGSIESNEAKGGGGGVYVYDGAVFQIKGDVRILDNYMASVATGATNNNAYLNGSAVIEVIGPLSDDAIIYITPNGTSSAYVTFDNGTSSGSTQTDLSHFTIDNNDGDDYSTMIVGDKVVVYGVTEWDDAGTWDGTIATNLSGNLPTSSDDITINRTVKIPSNCTAEARNITLGTYGSIIIEDGGQLKNNNAVAVTAKKGVEAADEDDQTGWYLISSPMANPSIADNTNLITTDYYDPSYDLYRFNEAAEKQWENYRAGHEDFTTLQNGRGYLYRNADNHKINIDGTLNVSDITYNLSCSSSELTGFNLIGNPYSQNITLLNTTLVDNSSEAISTQLTGFYRLTANGSTWTSEITSGDATTIAPLEGFLVQVDEPRTVKFSRTPRGGSKSNGDNIKFTVANSQYEDVAYALFENGLGLNKIEHMNEDVPMVYININKEDFAIATLNDEVKQFNLNLEAKTTPIHLKLSDQWRFQLSAPLR